MPVYPCLPAHPPALAPVRPSVRPCNGLPGGLKVGLTVTNSMRSHKGILPVLIVANRYNLHMRTRSYLNITNIERKSTMGYLPYPRVLELVLKVSMLGYMGLMMQAATTTG